ncbi:MAG TPA: DUF2837 family protein [Candidatus Rubrimentiphilum sp.]|nr:DUF2837 family protein [Candidatus Rubrimentiphilum sp.]
MHGTVALHNATAVVPFFSWQLFVALAINVLIQAIQIGAYAARLAGVRTGRIATSIALFNLFVLASRLATLVYTLMLAPLSDRAGNAVKSLILHHAPVASVTQVQQLFELQLRLIVVAGTAGTVLGGLLLPMFTYLYVRGVRSFERTKSIPHSLWRLFDPRVIVQVFAHIRVPHYREIFAFSAHNIPMRLLISNVVVTAVYAIGVVAAYYASVIDINVARTAVTTSGIINGIGTVAFTFFVDPTSSMIVDEAAKGERPVKEVQSMVFYLALTAIVGWLVSQALLWPAAWIIAQVAHLVNLGR